MKFNVILEPAAEGGYTARVPGLEGCFTEGDTLDTVMANAREAILCYLQGLRKVNEIRSTPGALMREIEIVARAAFQSDEWRTRRRRIPIPPFVKGFP